MGYQTSCEVHIVNMSEEPMDIDNLELVRYQRERQQCIEKKLLESYAKEMAKMINKLVMDVVLHMDLKINMTASQRKGYGCILTVH